VDCPQQKCLIHLIRDLNSDIQQEPFNIEINGIAKAFAVLLKKI
jgi:hypothetical protein